MNEKISTESSPDKMRQFVIFELGSENFCIDLLSVREIIRIVEITRLPEAPEFVEGVITLRGEVVPIIDLRKRFGFTISENENSDNRIMIIETADNILGFIVDGVREVLRTRNSEIKPPPAMITSEIDKRYFEGVITNGNMLLIVLIADLIFAQEELYSVKQIDVA